MRLGWASLALIGMGMGWLGLPDPLGSGHAQVVPPVESAPNILLQTAADIARYPDSTPGKQPAVLLEAVVTYVDPSTVFLQDDTGATFFQDPRGRYGMRPGQRIRIEGTRLPGLFIGGITPEKVEVISTGDPPPPRPITREQMASGVWHYHVVELEGVGRSFESTGESTGILKLNTSNGVVDLHLETSPAEPQRLIDAWLKVRGLAAGTINDQRQLVSPYLKMHGEADITVITPPPADPFAQPLVPIHDLSQAGLHRIRIRGVAQAAPINEGLFLRQEKRGIHVQVCSSRPPVMPGDVVEAVGFAEPGIYSARLVQAEYRVTGHETPPSPDRVTEADLKRGRDAELITLRTTILQRVNRSEHTELNAQLGDLALTIVTPKSLDQAVRPGALVEVTGLCQVTSARSQGYRAAPQSYDIQVPDSEDIRVLGIANPWLSPQRLALVLIVVGGIALLAVLWAGALRRQVKKQLAVIESKAQHEAVTEERQRIAREFHDTLEQELAGLSLRLDAASSLIRDDKPRQLISQLRRLLLRVQTETRDFVLDLRRDSPDDAPLEVVMAELIQHLQAGSETLLSFAHTHSGPALPVPALAQHHLLRLTREAIHNAIKHAQSPAIEVALETHPDHLTLSIRDHGRGFDSQHAPPPGHFGLQGMKERAAKLGAELQIHSTPGAGTEVRILWKAESFPQDYTTSAAR